MASTGLVKAPRWAKHLKEDKKTFWSRERKAAQREIENWDANTPLKAKGKSAPKIKCKFGIERIYQPLWSSADPWKYTTWYETKKSRDQAYEHELKQGKTYCVSSKIER